MKDVFDELEPKYGDWTLDRFTPDFLMKCQQAELARGMENSSVNRKLQIFTTITSYSLEKRRITFNPTLGFSKLKEVSPEMTFWDQTEATSFLRFAQTKYPKDSPKRWVYVVYLTALNTALRAGEIWGLMPIDIAKDALRITVRRQFHGVLKDMAPPKGKKSRVVPCNQLLKTELVELIAKNKIASNETVFMNQKRKPICHDNFVHRQFALDLKEWCKNGIGREIRFHDLRHTATTLLISSGVDVRTAKEVCGHSDIKTTMIYAHLVDSNIDKAALNFSIGGEEEMGHLT
jgi:integrase